MAAKSFGLEDELVGEIKSLRHGLGCLDRIHLAGRLHELIGHDDISDEYMTSRLLTLIQYTFKSGRADNLLVALNLLKEYDHIKSVNKRRESYQEKCVPDKDQHLSLDTLTYHEDKMIKQLVKKILQLKRSGKLPGILKKVKEYYELATPYYLDFTNQEAAEESPLAEDNIPYAQNPYFMDHSGMLAKIRNYFVKADADNQKVAPVQTIYGMGGVGKTQTALAYSYEYLDVADGYTVIWWIKSETGEAAEDIVYSQVDSFVEEYYEPDEYRKWKGLGGSREAIKRAFRTWFERSAAKWLLIFDNVDDMKSIEPLVPRRRIGVGHVLITTRHAAEGVKVDLFDYPTAVDFLAKRTGITDEQNAKLIAERLGRLPLALEHVAAYVSKKLNGDYSVYLKRLEDYGLMVFKDYENSVNIVWKITVDRLRDGAKQLIRMCSYFAPEAISFSVFVDKAATISDALPPNEQGEHLPEALLRDLSGEMGQDDIIEDLTAYSLTDYDYGTGQLSIHRLLQEVIRSEIDTDTSYIKYCLQLFKIMKLTTDGFVETFAEKLEEMHELHGAVQAGLDSNTRPPFVTENDVSVLAAKLGKAHETVMRHHRDGNIDRVREFLADIIIRTALLEKHNEYMSPKGERDLLLSTQINRMDRLIELLSGNDNSTNYDRAFFSNIHAHIISILSHYERLSSENTELKEDEAFRANVWLGYMIIGRYIYYDSQDAVVAVSYFQKALRYCSFDDELEETLLEIGTIYSHQEMIKRYGNEQDFPPFEVSYNFEDNPVEVRIDIEVDDSEKDKHLPIIIKIPITR